MSGNCENKFGNLAAMLEYLNQAGEEQKVRGVRKDGGGNEVDTGEKQRRMDGGREREKEMGGARGVETEVSCLRRRLAEKDRGKKSLSCVCEGVHGGCGWSFCQWRLGSLLTGYYLKKRQQ